MICLAARKTSVPSEESFFINVNLRIHQCCRICRDNHCHMRVFCPAQKFKMPHDIVVTKNGSVFVGDAASDSVIKFVPSESKFRISLCMNSNDE